MRTFADNGVETFDRQLSLSSNHQCQSIVQTRRDHRLITEQYVSTISNLWAGDVVQHLDSKCGTV